MTEKSGKQIRFDGWMDWRRPLLYIRTAPRQGKGELLIQAVPGVVAIRATPDGQGSDSSKPPGVPPVGNWRLRPLGLPLPREPDPMDALMGLMLALTAEHPDDPNLLQQTDSHWLHRDSVDGAAVQVLLGPAVMPKKQQTPKRELKAHGGAVAYWVGAGARLVRLETYLSPTVTAQVDIDRTQQAEFTAAQAFGGGGITARAVTATEAKALAEMRHRTLGARGGRLTITLPMMPNRMVQAHGWIDFRRGVAYAAAHDLNDPTWDVLLHVSHKRMSLHKAIGETAPLPAPPTQWESNAGGDTSDLDVLLREVLSIGVDVRDNAKDLATRANRLRLDEIGGRPVAVFEIGGRGEPTGVPGSALFRYWIDPTGVVHRVEIRTRLGFAQLDIDYGKIPALPARM